MADGGWAMAGGPGRCRSRIGRTSQVGAERDGGGPERTTRPLAAGDRFIAGSEWMIPRRFWTRILAKTRRILAKDNHCELPREFARFSRIFASTNVVGSSDSDEAPNNARG